MKRREPPPFTSRMTLGETVAALVYLPVHVALLPAALIAGFSLFFPGTDGTILNFVYYAVGAVYMLLFELRFLRREFDPLCDRPFGCLIEILSCYGLMLAFNLLVNGLFSLFPADNPNNSAIVDLAEMNMGAISAVSIFLAPIVEELMFRAGIFGLLRRRSRLLAYSISILLFSLYHIWNYAFADPRQLLYLVEYIPASYVLCRCYERTDTVWGAIFLHMLINGISLYTLSAFEDFLCLIL